MSLCLNPNCLQENGENSKFCHHCRTKLLLKDRYRGVKIISQGGFGRTFLAVDEHKPSKPPCVIKQFFPSAQGSNSIQKAAELFEQEAVRLESLGSHNQIPELFAYFIQDDRQYLVQEFIDGKNLLQELADNGVFNEREIIKILVDMLNILEFIHKQQVIHRDIKPDNIIRRQQDGKLVLVDFGIAKFLTLKNRFVAGTAIGTPGYIAPEQVRGKAREASDLYSLGVTCICLLTKTSPLTLFDLDKQEWVWKKYLNGNSVSSELSKILDKLIEPKTKKRFQYSREVLDKLDKLIEPGTTKQFQFPGQVLEKLNSRSQLITQSVFFKPSPITSNFFAILWLIIAATLGGLGIFTFLNIRKTHLNHMAILERIEEVKAKGEYDECINQAKAISADSPISEQAKILFQDCHLALRNKLIKKLEEENSKIRIDRAKSAFSLTRGAMEEIIQEFPGQNQNTILSLIKEIMQFPSLDDDVILLDFKRIDEAKTIEWIAAIYNYQTNPDILGKGDGIIHPGARTSRFLKEDIYTKVIESNSQDGSGYEKRAEVRVSLGKYREAIEDYSQAIQLNPQNANTYEKRAGVYQRLKDYPKVIEDYTQIIQINPKDANIYEKRAEVYKNKLQNYQKAIEDYSQAIQLNPQDANIYQKRAEIYENRLKKYQKAIEDYTQAIQLNSNNHYLYRRRANLHIKLGNLPEAIENYTEEIKLKPDNASTYYNRGIARYNLGDKEEAIEDFNQALKLKSDYGLAYRDRGNARYDLGEKEEALEDFDQAIKLQPDLKLKPDYASDYNDRGIARYGLEDYSGAMADYTIAIKINPNYASPYYNRGLIYQEQEQKEEARQDFLKAADLYQQEGNTEWYKNALNRLQELE